MKPHPSTIAILLAISAGHYAAPSRSASSIQGGAAALRAAVEYMAKEKVQGTVEVDPREFVSSAADTVVEKTHSQATLTLLAIQGVATVASVGRARQCAADPSPGSCKSAGRAVFLSLAVPRIDGRSATIELRVAAARTPGKADSVEAKSMKSAAERDSFLRRLARPTISRYRLDLVRETTAWVVTRAVLVAASE